MSSVANNPDQHERLLLLPLAVLGAVIVLAATPLGLDVGYDSVFYLNGAENIANGAGFSRTIGDGSSLPISHYTPLYSLALATMLLQDIEVGTAARVLAALMTAANIYLIGYVIARYGRSMRIAVATQSLALISPLLLNRHLEAMSEPLYFMLMMLTLLILDGELRTHKNRDLIAAGLLVGLAYLTRYVGLSLALTGALALLLLSRRPMKGRVLDTAIFASIAAVPALIWLGRNALLSGSFSNRTIGFHPPQFDDLLQAARSVSRWLALPSDNLRQGALFLFVFAVFLAFLLARNLRSKEEAGSESSLPMIRLLALHAIVYGLVLLTSITFFDASTRLNDRILSPLYLTILLLSALLICQDGWLLASRWRAVSLVALWALLFAGYTAQSIPRIQSSRENGLGFNSLAWRNSPTMRALRSAPALLYSNEPLVMLFVNKQPAFNVPERTDPVLESDRVGYEEALERMRSNLENQNGWLVVFHPEGLRPETGSLVELTEDLHILETYPDGIIYVSP